MIYDVTRICLAIENFIQHLDILINERIVSSDFKDSDWIKDHSFFNLDYEICIRRPTKSFSHKNDSMLRVKILLLIINR